MKSKLIKSKEKNQTRSGRSKSAMQREQTQKVNYQKLVSKAQPLQIFDVPQLRNLKDNFKKLIENPINAEINMNSGKSSQRCLLHNNVITLYCLNERKPLCVTCMYQNNTHKKHKVIPLNRAGQELHEQIVAYVAVVDKQLNKTSKFMGQSHSFLQRTERDFPEIILRVDKFYKNLSKLLAQKHNQQIQHIQQTWARLKYQYGSFAKQLENINIYLVEKVAQLRSKGGEQNLLMSRNIASHLANIKQVIPSNLCQYHETTYEEDLRNFEEVRNIINDRLVFTSPFQEKIPRADSRKRLSANRSLRSSLQRVDNSFSKSKTKKEGKSPAPKQTSLLEPPSYFKPSGSSSPLKKY